MSINSLDRIKPGDLFTTDGHDVWRVVSCCERPTITLKNMETAEEKGGAVGSLIVQDFIRLIPEQDLEHEK